MCIEYVGIAENIYDKLNLSQGQRVAVIGGDTLGNIIAQVLQYHKIIPIVIDNTQSNLDKARTNGIYYAYSADDEVVSNVMAIYSASSRLPASLASRIVGKQKSIVLSGFTSLHSAIDLRDVLEKDLHVFGVTNAANYTDSVINMLVHGAVNIDSFDKEIVNQFDPVKILTDLSERISASNKSNLTVLKLMF